MPLEDTQLPLTSPDPVTDLLAQLRAAAPQVFSEGRVDFEKLRAALGDQVEQNPERYGLNWAGKSDAFRNVRAPSIGTLLPMPEDSVNWEQTENLIIEGDNLEVLKLLQKSYHGQVKMIYIDPPYNTGNDFIYPDNYRQGLDDYLRFSGQVGEDGSKQSTNSETSGRFHSDWLSMMYPRLFLARNLLTDDGILLISIDDNEVTNLRLVLNELFGDEGFIGAFVWRRRVGSSLATSWISADHEYVLAYSKDPSKLYVLGDERDMSKYSIPDGNGRFYASMPLTVGMTKDMRPNQWYELKHPTTGRGYWPPLNRVWGYYPPTMEKKIKENKIIWPDDFPERKITTPRLKTYPEDAKRDRKPLSTWIAEKSSKPSGKDAEDVFTTSSAKNEEGTRALNELFPDGIFSYPKPPSLIKAFVEQFTKNNDLVLDFFAGSGTSGQAVLDQNRDDGENRRFILVQLPEKTEHTEYPTIADITRERVRRVIAKLAQEDSGKKSERGFRAFKLSSSNFRIWNAEKISGYLSGMIEVDNSIYDVVPYDSEVEHRFAEAMSTRKDIKLFIKLPPWFKVETPVGTYNPDWAIVREHDEKVYLVRETKGTLDEMKLRGTEWMKIRCGEAHFTSLGVDYAHVVDAGDI